jgi:predicted transcriptional regulator of viral defense system
LRGLSKPYFTVADLEKVLGLKRESLYVTLSRLVKAGILVRLRKNAYKLFIEPHDVEKMANELYFPAYLSFESALAKFGVLSQIPYTLTFATPRPSKRISIGETEVVYRHLKKDLFFGYALGDGKYTATPEKALLDELYLMSRGKAKVDLAELDFREIKRAVLEDYARKFPAYIGGLLGEVRGRLGTTPVTLETKERIAWRGAKRRKP